MAKDTNIESLFKEHSFEEIESVRDNLALEIEKRTDLLKSIVKEKYKDIVETTDAIHSMKVKLEQAGQSLWNLDSSISEFYTKIREPIVESREKKQLGSDRSIACTDSNEARQKEDYTKLANNISEIWKCFDSGDLKTCVRYLNESLQLVNTSGDKISDSMKITVNRAKEIIQNSIWHRIRSANADQIGLIAGSDKEELYRLSLECSIDFLIKQLHVDISRVSYYSIIERFQPSSCVEDGGNQLQVPCIISPELSMYLFNVCRTINTIAGFDISKFQRIEGLRLTLRKVLQVYEDILPIVDKLAGQTRRRRALQLYFDLMYLRILLNTSKNIDLIEELDPELTQLSGKYEVMLDTIELYMVSETLHSNAVQISRATFRLYGLLIPHLQ